MRHGPMDGITAVYVDVVFGHLAMALSKKSSAGDDLLKVRCNGRPSSKLMINLRNREARLRSIRYAARPRRRGNRLRGFCCTACVRSVAFGNGHEEPTRSIKSDD